MTTSYLWFLVQKVVFPLHTTISTCCLWEEKTVPATGGGICNSGGSYGTKRAVVCKTLKAIMISPQHSCGNIKLLVTLALQQNFAVLPAENRVRCHTHLWRTKRGFARVFDDASTVFHRLVSTRRGVVECY